MQAGKLRHRLTIYHKQDTRTPTGAVRKGQWQAMATIWGQFTPLSVKDMITGQAANIDVTARATIRHRTDIKKDMQIGVAGRMYDIVGEPLADKGSGREYLTLMLKVMRNEN